MTFDTDEKLDVVRRELNARIDDKSNSSERRITDLYKQNRADFAELRGLMQGCSARIADTQLEVAGIRVRIDSLATQNQLKDTIGQIHDWALEEMRKCSESHHDKSSLAPLPGLPFNWTLTSSIIILLGLAVFVALKIGGVF